MMSISCSASSAWKGSTLMRLQANLCPSSLVTRQTDPKAPSPISSSTLNLFIYYTTFLIATNLPRIQSEDHPSSKSTLSLLIIKLTPFHHKMYNSRMTVGSRPRQSSYHKCSLGNTAPRYNSEVAVQRKKYLVSSTQNSDDVPDWMSRTQKFHFRQSNRNRSLFTNPQSGFKNVQQTYVYANLPKAINPEGQFDRLIKPRTRNKWEMKNQTFHLEWPRPETELRKESESRLSSFGATSRPGSRQNEIMRFQMPKYGYFETPLHRQRETPIKIGHPLTVNTTYVQ